MGMERTKNAIRKLLHIRQPSVLEPQSPPECLSSALETGSTIGSGNRGELRNRAGACQARRESCGEPGVGPRWSAPSPRLIGGKRLGGRHPAVMWLDRRAGAEPNRRNRHIGGMRFRANKLVGVVLFSEQNPPGDVKFPSKYLINPSSRPSYLLLRPLTRLPIVECVSLL